MKKFHKETLILHFSDLKLVILFYSVDFKLYLTLFHGFQLGLGQKNIKKTRREQNDCGLALYKEKNIF